VVLLVASSGARHSVPVAAQALAGRVQATMRRKARRMLLRSHKGVARHVHAIGPS